VFVVGYLGDWRRAAAVLFERESVRGDTPQTRRKGGRWWNGDHVSQTLDAVLAKGQMMPDKNRFPVVISPRRGSALCSPQTSLSANPAGNRGALDTEDTSATAAVLDRLKMIGLSTASDEGFSTPADLRRVTPLESERLQGFPDNWTDVPGATETARYLAIGNSMAVPVMRWIGERINAQEVR
jgi:DNA (cytosine-5)-methyltransferase 1